MSGKKLIPTVGRGNLETGKKRGGAFFRGSQGRGKSVGVTAECPDPVALSEVGRHMPVGTLTNFI